MHMKKGVFLKENRTQKQRDPGRRTGEECAVMKEKRLREQKRHQRRLWSIGIMLALSIVVVVIIAALPSSPLEGKWDMDGVTSYEFHRNGKGAMVLPSAEYEFAYTVKDNILYIDFDYDGAKDAQYVFAVDGDKLSLDGGNTTTQGTYVLTKSE